MTATVPMSRRPAEDLPGHWLLARLGKRVLRPGGKGLTLSLLDKARIEGADVIELAPGLGWTAMRIVERGPRSYTGVDEDPDAAASAEARLRKDGTARAIAAGIVTAKAAESGLPDGSADVVVGEAMLTMQGAKGKDAILAEAHRLLRPGGRYAIHELALEPDTLADEHKTEIRKALARSIKVNARPQTTTEWTALLESHGFAIESVQHASMDLLKARRNIEDEGLLGVAKITVNLLRMPDARKRVLAMRSVFNRYSRNISAIALVAVKQ